MGQHCGASGLVEAGAIQAEHIDALVRCVVAMPHPVRCLMVTALKFEPGGCGRVCAAGALAPSAATLARDSPGRHHSVDAGYASRAGGDAGTCAGRPAVRVPDTVQYSPDQFGT